MKPTVLTLLGNTSKYFQNYKHGMTLQTDAFLDLALWHKARSEIQSMNLIHPIVNQSAIWVYGLKKEPWLRLPNPQPNH